MKNQIKNLFTLLLLGTFFFTSCKSEQEAISENSYKVRDNVVQAKLSKLVKAKLEYPESFEFVELKVKDSVLYSDNIKNTKDYYEQIIVADKKIIEKQKLYQKEGSSMYKEEKVKDLEASIIKNEKILIEIDKISTKLGDINSETASCNYSYKFKSKNVSGKLGSYNYFAQAGHAPNYKVVMVAEEKNLRSPNPNDFPGYNEMIQSFE
ncbi:hypothetical protein [Psychroserpens sp. NJDZ02]|uniref:hypothetical protein n=1 Tax=Psychroserpens sp. NJDZ02 TaxID=2570561 RepID=UPI0010A8BBF3|nr:hypothetical protein [Psychroserpens sp. NJDZ02]QCE39972.1 hypothetical protein E9099_00485 [Psychroserpens sp. NJDZ02]